MPLELNPFSPDELSEPLKKILGPGAPPAIKTMAARGLAPLGPHDLATALFQLSLDADETLAAVAQKTAAGLPERVLQAALAEALDARVLHFFARYVHQRPQFVEQIVYNRNTADETFAYFATQCTERELEMIAAAEERCLRCPTIVEALYFNDQARQSTIDRLIDLCVRNGVMIDRIPAFKEAAAALALGAAAPSLAEQEAEDDLFREAVDAGREEVVGVDASTADETVAKIIGEGGEGAQAAKEEEEKVDPRRMSIEKIRELKLSTKIRLATVGSAFHRAVLIRDSNKQVALAAVKSPGISDMEVVRYASNRALNEDVIRYIANHREFLKSYQVKLNLVNNPKCPLPTSMRLLTYLREGDLKALSRSKSVSATLAGTAKKILQQKAK
ncbi:MAG: hypothetical protein HY906_02020 [Deltaproteobacteria bacterium]|nr:hypothetical protein [Deltaproteobacteria bacterium]